MSPPGRPVGMVTMVVVVAVAMMWGVTGGLWDQNEAYSLEMHPAYPDVGTWDGRAEAAEYRRPSGRLIVEEGDTVRLNCTLTGTDTPAVHNSSELVFRRNNVPYPARFIAHPSAVTAIATLPNLPVGEGWVWCLLRKDMDNSPLRHWTSIGVTIARRPLPPELVRCVVKRWTTLNCTWGPTQNEQHNYTHTGLVRSALMWRTPANRSGWQRCADEAKTHHTGSMETCELPVTPALLRQPVQIYVTAGNALANVTSGNHNVDLIQTVLPTAVVRLSARSDGSSVYTISWRSPVPTPFRPVFEGRMAYVITSSFSRIASVTVDTASDVYHTSNLQISLNVVHYAVYNVTVTSRVAPNGTEGASATYNFTTPPKAPSSNPGIFPGYHELHAPRGARRVGIFWKGIAEKSINGPKLRYVVSAVPDFDHPQRTTFTTTGTSGVLTLHKGVTYALSVRSRNTAGQADDSSLQTLTIPARSDGPVLVGLIAEGEGSSVFLRWQPVLDSPTLNVFWCSNMSYQSYTCKSGGAWHRVGENRTKAVVDLGTDYRHAMVGLAAASAGAAAQMEVVDCVYHRMGVPNPPEKIQVRTLGIGANMTWFLPACQQRVKGGYIRHFRLDLCQTEDEEHRCKGNTSISLLVDGSARSAHVTGMTSGATYRVTICSIARAGGSHPSAPVTFVAYKSWLTGGVWTGLVISSVILLLCLLIGVVATARYCQRSWNKFRRGIPITVPAAGLIGMDLNLSEASDRSNNTLYSSGRGTICSEDCERYEDTDTETYSSHVAVAGSTQTSQAGNAYSTVQKQSESLQRVPRVPPAYVPFVAACDNEYTEVSQFDYTSYNPPGCGALDSLSSSSQSELLDAGMSVEAPPGHYIQHAGVAAISPVGGDGACVAHATKTAPLRVSGSGLATPTDYVPNKSTGFDALCSVANSIPASCIPCSHTSSTTSPTDSYITVSSAQAQNSSVNETEGVYTCTPLPNRCSSYSCTPPTAVNSLRPPPSSCHQQYLPHDITVTCSPGGSHHTDGAGVSCHHAGGLTERNIVCERPSVPDNSAPCIPNVSTQVSQIQGPDDTNDVRMSHQNDHSNCTVYTSHARASQEGGCPIDAAATDAESSDNDRVPLTKYVTSADGMVNTPLTAARTQHGRSECIGNTPHLMCANGKVNAVDTPLSAPLQLTDRSDCRATTTGTETDNEGEEAGYISNAAHSIIIRAAAQERDSGFVGGPREPTRPRWRKVHVHVDADYVSNVVTGDRSRTPQCEDDKGCVINGHGTTCLGQDTGQIRNDFPGDMTVSAPGEGSHSGYTNRVSATGYVTVPLCTNTQGCGASIDATREVGWCALDDGGGDSLYSPLMADTSAAAEPDYVLQDYEGHCGEVEISCPLLVPLSDSTTPYIY